MAVTNLYATGATPRFIALGADDQSIRLEPLGEEQTPQHLPKFYILANKGSQKDHIVDAAGAKAIYGDDVFTLDILSYSLVELYKLVKWLCYKDLNLEA